MRVKISMLALVLACSASHVESTVDTTELTVTAVTDRSSVAAGQTLRITVTVTNRSVASRTLRFSSGCQTDYEFLDARGEVAATSRQMCLQALTQRTLEPGESFSDAHTWSRGSIDSPQLAPGDYQLRAVLLAIQDTVRSATVPITIP